MRSADEGRMEGRGSAPAEGGRLCEWLMVVRGASNCGTEGTVRQPRLDGGEEIKRKNNERFNSSTDQAFV